MILYLLMWDMRQRENQDPEEAFNLHIETCTEMFIAALFPTVKNEKQTKCHQ